MSLRARFQLFLYIWLQSSEWNWANHPRKVIFKNHADQPLSLSFVHPDSPESPDHKDTIAPGGEATQDTWPGHVFEIRAEGTTPARITVVNHGEVECRIASTRGIVLKAVWDKTDARQRQMYQGPTWDKLVVDARQKCLQDLVDYPSDAMHFCSKEVAFTRDNSLLRSRFQIPDELEWRRKWSEKHKEREKQSSSQRAAISNFTTKGFETFDVPAEILRPLREFWRSGRRTLSSPEISDQFDPNLSPRESESWKLPVPEHLQALIGSALRPLIESWANLAPESLILTSLYGLRLYRKNSKLYMHVDRKETHVLSAILEIGYLGWSQPDVDEDFSHVENWPLEIKDHSGSTHQIRNRPGQMIFYESASCDHGRPGKFPGRESASLFVHFAPRNWADQLLAGRTEL